MKIDEYRTKLSGLLSEGADVGKITDELMTDYNERLNEAAESAAKDVTIADLTAKIADLNNTNIKLIEKIKYSEPAPEKDPEPVITLENLFD